MTNPEASTVPPPLSAAQLADTVQAFLTDKVPALLCDLSKYGQRSTAVLIVCQAHKTRPYLAEALNDDYPPGNALSGHTHSLVLSTLTEELQLLYLALSEDASLTAVDTLTVPNGPDTISLSSNLPSLILAECTSTVECIKGRRKKRNTLVASVPSGKSSDLASNRAFA